MPRLTRKKQIECLKNHIAKYGGITAKDIETDLAVTPTTANAIFNTIANVTDNHNHLNDELYVLTKTDTSKKPIRIMPYDLYKKNINWYFKPVCDYNEIITFIETFITNEKNKAMTDQPDEFNQVLNDIALYRNTQQKMITIMLTNKPELKALIARLSAALLSKYPYVERYQLYNDQYHLSGIIFKINHRKDDFT